MISSAISATRLNVWEDNEIEQETWGDYLLIIYIQNFHAFSGCQTDRRIMPLIFKIFSHKTLPV